MGTTRGALLVSLVAVTGCSSTAFFGTAAAREGYEYVVGHKDGRSKIWLCPNRQPGRCQEVRVEVADD